MDNVVVVYSHRAQYYNPLNSVTLNGTAVSEHLIKFGSTSPDNQVVWASALLTDIKVGDIVSHENGCQGQDYGYAYEMIMWNN